MRFTTPIGSLALAALFPFCALAQFRNSPDVYSAKFVCGTRPATAPPTPGPVVEGTYATSVNVYNPNSYPSTVQFHKRISLSYPAQQQQPGPLSDFRTDILPGGQSLQIDCPDIRSFFKPPLPATDFLEGFVVIEMDPLVQNPLPVYLPLGLDVVSVVTASQVAAQVRSIHLEKVPRETVSVTRPSLGISRSIDRDGTRFAVVAVAGADSPGTLIEYCGPRVVYSQDLQSSEVARGVKVTLEQDPGGACRFAYFYPKLGVAVTETGP